MKEKDELREKVLYRQERHPSYQLALCDAVDLLPGRVIAGPPPLLRLFRQGAPPCARLSSAARPPPPCPPPRPPPPPTPPFTLTPPPAPPPPSGATDATLHCPPVLAGGAPLGPAGSDARGHLQRPCGRDQDLEAERGWHQAYHGLLRCVALHGSDPQRSQRCLTAAGRRLQFQALGHWATAVHSHVWHSQQQRLGAADQPRLRVGLLWR